MFRISLLGKNSKSVLADFDAAGINYEILRPPPGVVMNSGEWVDFANYVKAHAENSGWAIAIAAVLRGWMKARAGRKIAMTLPDNTNVQTEGLSPEEFALCVEVAKKTVVMDTGKGDDSITTTPMNPS